MGNPCRYVLDGKFIGRPKIDIENKQLVLTQYVFREQETLKDHYPLAEIDFYSAPDCIFSYTNGNTNKDEFHRYSRDVFKELKLLKKEEDVAGEYVVYTYSYDELKSHAFNYSDPECETNIPMGKFMGMTHKQVLDYKRKNRYHGQMPRPSLEAIQAAIDAQPITEWAMDVEEMNAVLTAAYKIDM